MALCKLPDWNGDNAAQPHIAALFALLFVLLAIGCLAVSAMFFLLAASSKQFGTLEEMLLMILWFGLGLVVLQLSWFLCGFSVKYAKLVVRRTRPAP